MLRYWDSPTEGNLLVQTFRGQNIHHGQFNLLQPHVQHEKSPMLKDEAINLYLDLLAASKPGILNLSTWFLTSFTGRRAASESRRRVSVISSFIDGGGITILLPINHSAGDGHWSLLHYNVLTSTVSHFNSSASTVDDDFDSRLTTFVKLLEGRPRVLRAVKVTLPKDSVCPQQQNGVDCGPFTCMFAYAIVNGLDMAQRTQSCIHNFRIHMAESILALNLTSHV